MLDNPKSQSALEYMMTYGWAILIIVIVAGVLYSLGIFSPSNSASTTITGFSGLGVTQAACVNSVNNQILELYVSNALGYTVNVTKINVTGGSNGVSLSQNISSLLGAGQSGIFYVNGACNKSSSTYLGSATIIYTEPGQTFPGPYFSSGTVSKVSVSSDLNEVGYFNGGNNAGVYISTPAPVGSVTMTVVTWVQAENYPSARMKVVGNNIGGNSNFYFDVYGCGNDTVEFYTWTPASGWANTCSGSVMNFKEWNLIVGVFNNPTEYVYVNGVFQNSRTITSSNLLSPEGPLGIGGYDDSQYTGNISDVQIYSGALSAAQIQKIYNEGLGAAPISNAGLVGWWPLDGNANDYSGNNNNGINYDVTWVSP